MPKKEKTKGLGKHQKAILLSMTSASAPGAALDELNACLAKGWKVQTASLASGERGGFSALVIVEGKECKCTEKPAKEEKKPKEEKPVKEEKKKKK